MGVSTAQVLAPKTILKAISQLELPGTSLQRLFGWGFGGANVDRQSGRNFSYDVMQATRSIAVGRMPAQSSSRQAPQQVKNVSGTFPRAAEVIPLLDEELLNRRAIGHSSDELDRGGESYITRQEVFLAQRFANLIEFQTAAMLRGQYRYEALGDDLRHSFTGAGTAVNFGIPSSNQGDLDMLGDGPILSALWSNNATDIPQQLHSINAAMVRLTGMGLAHVVLTSVGWKHVLENTKVQEQGGSSQVAWESMKRVGAGEFTAVLRAIPWVTFHIVDYGLSVWTGSAETFEKLIEDDHAAFFPQPSSRWVQFLEGSEIVTEGPGGPRSERFGFYPYSYPTHDPSGWDLCAVFNGLPGLYLPEAIAYGQIA
jgi:hypothetical protein